MMKLFIALCLLSCFAGVAFGTEKFAVQGRVYCDTCRAGFETTATDYSVEAKVMMECRNYTTNAITHKVDSLTDKTGTYSINVEDVHDGEICEVVLVESKRKDCSEIKAGRDRARIILTNDSGMTTNIRYANSLGFLIETPLSQCGEVLQQYALSDDLL